jgi:hypothetical protein
VTSRRKALRVSEQALLEAQQAIAVALSCIGCGDVMGAYVHADEAHQLAQRASRELGDQVEGRRG